MLATATLRLALCSVYRALTGELSDRVDDWQAKIIPESGDSLTAREMQRQFGSIIDRVADELELIHASGLDDIAQPSYFDALSATASALDQLGLTFVASRDLSDSLPSDLHRIFLPTVETAWDNASIDQYVRAYGRSALTLCCYALIAWTRIIPTERSQAAWGILVNSTRLVDQSRTMLLEVRRAGVTHTGSASRIVGAQRRDLSSALGQIELFGLPVEKRFRRVPITVSYLAGRLTGHPEKLRSKGVPLEKLTKILLGQGNKNRSRGIRLIITGRPGSGKTTAAQWWPLVPHNSGCRRS